MRMAGCNGLRWDILLIFEQSVNPGNLRSDLQRYGENGIIHKISKRVVLFPPINGAYSELFCGLSPEVTADKSGSYGKHP